MGELYDKIWLYANRAGYDLVNYKSEEVTIKDNSFQMPQKNVSVTAVWEPSYGCMGAYEGDQP